MEQSILGKKLCMLIRTKAQDYWHCSYMPWLGGENEDSIPADVEFDLSDKNDEGN